MNKRIDGAIVALFGICTLLGCSDSPGEVRLSPRVFGNHPISKCSYDKLANNRPDKILTLHIPSTILADLQKGQVKCAYQIGFQTSCITSNDAGKQITPGDSDYDDDPTIKPVVEEPANIVSRGDNWNTPLDMQLGKYLTPGHTVMIKIVLEDPYLIFLKTKKGDTLTYAVQEGDVGHNKNHPTFTCLTPPKSQTEPLDKPLPVQQGLPNAQKAVQIIRLRARAYDNKPRLNGLNIGILVPIYDDTGKPEKAPDGTPIYMPINLDPMIPYKG